MNLWRWLITPDPTPGYTTSKLLRLGIRTMIFVVIATLVSGLLQRTFLGPYLRTWWGSMLLVLALYVPMMRFMAVDNFVTSPARPGAARPGAGAVPLSEVRVRPSAAKRRQEKKRFAGVRKAPPRFGGRR